MASTPRIRKLELMEIKPLKNPHEEGETLIKTLELQGSLRVHSDTQLSMARKMYVKGDLSPREIAKRVAVSVDVIRRWVLNFAWDEAKHEYEFSQYKKVSALARKYNVDVDRRADRLLHNVEGMVEEMLQQHQTAMDALDDWHAEVEEAVEEGKALPPKPHGLLSPKDLAALANTVKTTHTQRRLARGLADVKASDKQPNIHIEGNVEIQQNILEALSDHVGIKRDKFTAEVVRPDQLIEDAEFDELD